MCGCTSGKRQSKQAADMKMGERISRSVRAMKEGMNKNDPRYQSRYQKAMDASLAKDGSAKWLSRQKSRTNTLDHLETFKSRQFSTQEFARADDKSPLADKTTLDSERRSSFAGQAFETADSPFAAQTSRDASRQAREGGQTFRTQADVLGKKALRDSKMPEFIVLPEQVKNPAYTEDEVRRLLGRD